jgi:hypothetical protein
MKRNLIALGCAGLLAFGLSLTSFAGSVTDTDADGVPDTYDNCVNTPNGPNGSTGQCNSQEDGDGDGYGNACDGDITNDGVILGADLSGTLANANQLSDVIDFNCDGSTLAADISILLPQLNTVPGPSGLACAGVNPGAPTDCN